jgi:hypothetical protein
MAAVLDDDGLVIEPPYIREGLQQNFGPLNGLPYIIHINLPL